MKFKHRLAYYLFGLTMGAFVVLFVFNKRGQDFCYLPNCRVLKDFKTKGWIVSAEAQKRFDEKWVTQEDIKNTMEYGDVDFSRSNKPLPEGGKLYIIEGKTANNEPIEVEMVSFSDKSVLKDIKKQ